MEIGENSDGQSRALCGIRAGAQLIEKHQGTLIRLIPEGHNVCHMGGEGTEALLNTLLIPDIREDLCKKQKARAVKGGNVQAGLSHKGKQPQRFSEKRFFPLYSALR